MEAGARVSWGRGGALTREWGATPFLTFCDPSVWSWLLAGVLFNMLMWRNQGVRRLSCWR